MNTCREPGCANPPVGVIGGQRYCGKHLSDQVAWRRALMAKTQGAKKKQEARAAILEELAALALERHGDRCSCGCPWCNQFLAVADDLAALESEPTNGKA